MMSVLRFAYKFYWLSLLVIGVASMEAACIAAQNETPGKASHAPNVLLILADDLGYSDLGCYGGEIATPNLDRLAAHGLRYSQFYNTARCWPTRAALLTGYYAQQVNRDAWPGDTRSGQGKRPDWAPLLPMVLQSLGYRAYHAGKWHLDGLPLSSGFDHSYRLEDHNRLFAPQDHWLDDVQLPPVSKDSGYYATTEIADRSMQFLREHHAMHRDRPFFAYVAFTAPHFPLQAPASWIDKYRKLYAQGWDSIRDARWNRLKALGWNQAAGVNGGDLSSVEYNVGPPYPFPESLAALGSLELDRPRPWNQLTQEQQEFQATKMAIHAAMVEVMDREVGRILNQLQAMNAWDNTLIVFLSDNGASAEIMVRGDGHDRAAPPGSASTFLCLGPGWSTVCNTPFRKHKTWVHEGGIATPLIVHWPSRVRTTGQWSSQVGHVVDFFPTLLDVCGGERSEQGNPETYAAISEAGQRPERPGISLYESLAGKSLDGVPIERPTKSRSLWWFHEGNRALRVDQWKLVSSGKGGAWELYDLAQDRSETRDLAAQYPQRVQELDAQWQRLLPVDRR